MESPDSLSTPSLATVFFDKFEKEELQVTKRTACSSNLTSVSATSYLLNYVQ